jgi:hypothetical protein
MVATAVVVFRPNLGRGLAVVVAGLTAVGVASGLVSDWRATVPFVPVTALVVAWVWAAYWRPAVVVTPAGVELHNVTRTVELPWPTIQRVETRFALTLHTAYGTYAAWAAPAPGRAGVAAADREARRHLPESTYSGSPTRHRGSEQDGTTNGGRVNGGTTNDAGVTISSGDLGNAPSGQAAAIVRARWEELRDAGLLDNPVVEKERPTVHWHVTTLVTFGVLAAASVVGLLLG